MALALTFALDKLIAFHQAELFDMTDTRIFPFLQCKAVKNNMIILCSPRSSYELTLSRICRIARQPRILAV